MADFSKAHPFILQAEGGYSFDPHDNGGETYRGISRRNFPQWAGWELIDQRPLKQNEIIQSGIMDNLVDVFYKNNFWDNLKADKIDSLAVAAYTYDFYVNAGRNAVKELQKILGVAVDGLVGPGTLTAINGADAATLLIRLHNARIDYYRRIGTGNNERFLKGWLNRCNYLFAQLQ